MKRIFSWQITACFLTLALFPPCLSAAEALAGSSPGSNSPTKAALPAMARHQRASWQNRLTLGPGDVLNISLFEMPDTAQRELPVGPDGRITFLQARDLMVTGLTIDELRSKLDEALGPYYQNPRSIVTPAVFHSKKYLVLGAVPNSGVYVLDRPTTLIEALARAGGLETGVYNQNTVELADLAHSFLVRNGTRLSLDFEKLFQRGDLTQNVAMEPDDYLYIALASANEIYVLGEVNGPGVATFLPRSTVIGVISARGGFTTRAFKSRVLVARGSLHQLQTFVVDTGAILAGKQQDFKLQSKDIVYVSQSPWVRAEEILDTATSAFIQGMVVGTVGRKIGPYFTSPVIP